MGDFNKVLIKYEDNVDCQNLVDYAHTHGFAQIISRPTRITENTATSIDLVFTNNIHSVLSSNILTLDLSEHLATHTKISLNSSTTTASHRYSATEKNVYHEHRLFNDTNNLVFKQLINDETWEEVTEGLNAQES